MEIILIVIVVFFSFIFFVIKGVKTIKKEVNTLDLVILIIYILSLCLFALAMMTHSNSYHEVITITPVSRQCYSPFAAEHSLTLIFYFLVFNISILLVWLKGKKLPPLTLSLCLVFILIGIIFDVMILCQISKHDTTGLTYNNHRLEQVLFALSPLLSLLIGIRLVVQVIIEEINDTYKRTYKNKHLNYLNSFVATRIRNPIWFVILLLPVFLIVTVILILFGQDANSVVKVFTDTTTWKLSQQMHPPILDHRGHYLCTVAASGSPNIVKPLRFGKRNGDIIIVNRQLMIANAFEEMIQDSSPKLHYIIRKNYDEYGYNISKKINTIHLSNITYVLMKPLEWVFLICLYLFCYRPEQKINKQYDE